MSDNTADLPEPMMEIIDDFHAMPESDRLQLLLEFSYELAELPAKYHDHPELLEPVPECQSPIFLICEVEGTGDDAVVRLHFSAPPEAPTTRGFASILHQGLDGLTAGQIAAIPHDVPDRLGISAVVSPLRLRGMSGMLTRIKRQVKEKSAA